MRTTRNGKLFKKCTIGYQSSEENYNTGIMQKEVSHFSVHSSVQENNKIKFDKAKRFKLLTEKWSHAFTNV